MSTNYQKGRRFEYKLIEDLKDNGFDIAQRSKGSHSPIDIFAINIKEKKIKLIQAKKGKLSNNQINKILEDNKELTGKFDIEFKIIN